MAGFVYGANDIVAQTVSIIGVVDEANKLFCVTIKLIEAAAFRSNPQCVGAVLVDGANRGMAQTMGIERVRIEAGKGFGGVIELIESMIRAHPTMRPYDLHRRH